MSSARSIWTAAQGPPPNGSFYQWINNRGNIVGSFFDGSVHGFLIVRRHGHAARRAARPGAINTNAPGLNNPGDIVWFLYCERPSGCAFRRDRHGNYESLDAPTPTPASSTLAIGINAPGDIVGQYTHLGGRDARVRNVSDALLRNVAVLSLRLREIRFAATGEPLPSPQRSRQVADHPALMADRSVA